MAAWSRSASSLLRLWSGLAPLTKLTKLVPLTKLTDSAYRSELAHSAPIHGNATRMRALYPRTAAWAREQEQTSGGSLSGGSLSGGSASFDGAGAPLAALDGGIGAPLVSVCVVHHERGTLLKQALRSLRMQTLPAALFEGLVVDDGSTGREAIEALDEVSGWDELRSGRWRLIRLVSPVYLGRARNEAARHARGEFLYFLDDDNALKPHALSTLLRAAVASGAHILTTPNEKWPSLEPPPTADAYDTELWLPLGGSAALGIVATASATQRRW